MTKTTKKLLFAMLMVIVAAFMVFGAMTLSACGEEEPSNTTVTYTVSITGSDVSNGAVALKTGSTTMLSAAVLADGVEDSTLASDIVWSTSSSSVATVSSGTVTAVAAGTANITATYGTVSAKVTVTVTDIVYTVKITGDDLDEDGALSFDLSDTTFTSSVLKATVYADDEETTLSAEWTTSDSGVASCTGGTVIPVGVGTATLTATYKTAIATVKVTVTSSATEEIVGKGTLSGYEVTVYLDLNLATYTAEIYEVMTMPVGYNETTFEITYMDFTILTSNGAYGDASTYTDTMVLNQGVITENTYTADATDGSYKTGDFDGTYTVTFAYVVGETTTNLTFTVSTTNGLYTTSLAPLVTWGLLDAATATSSEDSATTLVGTGTAMSGTFDATVYIILDLTNNTAKLYEVWSAYGGYVNYTVVTPDGTAYGEAATMDGMTATIPEGAITANTDGTYTVTFTYLTLPITFTVTATTGTDGSTTYSTSLAPLVSFGLLDADDAIELVTISGTGTASSGTFDASVYITLDLASNTAQLYEVWSAYGGYVNYTVLTPDGSAYGTSSTMDGMTATIGDGTITANDDGTYSVTFYYLTYPITFTVSVSSSNVFTTSLAPLIPYGLLDSVTATSTTDSATTLAGTGTLGGADVSVYIVLDLTNNTAKLYETMTTMGMEFTIVSADSTDIYGTTLSGYDYSMGMAVGEGTITANTDGTYTVSFYSGAITFTVSESEGTYSTSLASLVSLSLLDSVTATSASADTTTAE